VVSCERPDQVAARVIAKTARAANFMLVFQPKNSDLSFEPDIVLKGPAGDFSVAGPIADPREQVETCPTPNARGR
jgi:hypothetical protein